MEWKRISRPRRERLEAALREYHARQERSSHPAGSFDKGGRWYPSETEERPCCGLIRRPSRSYPHSLNKHCRSVTHVAALFNVPSALIRTELAKDRAPRPPIEKRVRFKQVAVVGGEYVSIYDGSPWALGKTRREALPKVSKANEMYAMPGELPHGGGFYVYSTAEEAANRNSYPSSCQHADAPRVTLKCEVWGRHRDMGGGKQVWTHCAPIAVVA